MPRIWIFDLDLDARHAYDWMGFGVILNDDIKVAYHRISYTAPREDLPGPDGCDDDEIDVIFFNITHRSKSL